MVLASASVLIVMQLRTMVPLRVRVQRSMQSQHSSKKFRVRVYRCAQTVGKLC